jgi:hypothetical protein
VLISNHFVYFGKSAIEIPSQFNAIVKKGPGHKSQFDKQFVRNFVDWIESLKVIGKIGDPCIFKQNLCFRTTS